MSKNKTETSSTADSQVVSEICSSKDITEDNFFNHSNISSIRSRRSHHKKRNRQRGRRRQSTARSEIQVKNVDKSFISSRTVPKIHTPSKRIGHTMGGYRHATCCDEDNKVSTRL
jgi:hypothetical protein